MIHLKIAFLFILISSTCFGEVIEVTGKVTDRRTGKPIRNANAIVRGTSRGMPTNALGYFKLAIDLEKEGTIVVSHVTYQTVVIVVPEGAKTFAVLMDIESVRLPKIDLTLYNGKPLFGKTNLKKGPDVTMADSMEVVEMMARFPDGGAEGFLNLLASNFNYPENDLQGGTGQFLFSFKVNAKGEYSSTKCVMIDSTSNLCTELKRIIMELPQWIPAEQYGVPMDQTLVTLIRYGPNNYWRKQSKARKTIEANK